MKPCEAASHRRLRFVCTLLHSTQTTLLIHDRDTISSSELDAELKSTFGLRVLRTPVRAPQAHAYCALAGSIRLFSQLVSEAFIIVTNAPHESDAWLCQVDHFILCAYSADGCVADMSLSDYLSSDSLWAQITG